MTESAFSRNPRLTIKCDQCSHKFTKTLRGLENKPRFPCPACGAIDDVTKMMAKATAFSKVLRKYFEDRAANFNREMRRLSKR